jgi:hypothetical protein
MVSYAHSNCQFIRKYLSVRQFSLTEWDFSFTAWEIARMMGTSEQETYIYFVSFIFPFAFCQKITIG